MAKKVDFKLNDTLVRRRRANHDSPDPTPSSTPAPERAAVVAVDPPANAKRLARPPSSQRANHHSPDPAPPSNPAPDRAAVVAVDPPATVQRPASPPASQAPPDPRAPTRPISVQTSVLLPPFLWDRLADLASESGPLTTTNRLLIAVLHGRGPRDLAQAADDLEGFLSLPGEQTRVGDLWEERNVRLPIELRTRLDGLTRELAAAGVVQATRANLVAATLLLRGPDTAEDARTLMADLRAQAFRRALAGADSPASG